LTYMPQRSTLSNDDNKISHYVEINQRKEHS
jgi:hypothetical protein